MIMTLDLRSQMSFGISIPSWKFSISNYKCRHNVEVKNS